MNRDEIEKNAKIITTLLLQKEKLTLSHLCKVMSASTTNLVLALGLLAGKGRIIIVDNGDDLVIKSTYTFSQMYY